MLIKKILLLLFVTTTAMSYGAEKVKMSQAMRMFIEQDLELYWMGQCLKQSEQTLIKVKEINLMPNSKSNLAANENTYSGDYLMKVGINAFTTNQAFSRVIELTAE